VDRDLEHLIGRLEAVAGELDDLAFDRLREAASDGATHRPAGDKELMQARRAVDKAVGVLRQLAGSSADGSAT
jgi:hypothetical protein